MYGTVLPAFARVVFATSAAYTFSCIHLFGNEGSFSDNHRIVCYNIVEAVRLFIRNKKFENYQRKYSDTPGHGLIKVEEFDEDQDINSILEKMVLVSSQTCSLFKELVKKYLMVLLAQFQPGQSNNPYYDSSDQSQLCQPNAPQPGPSNDLLPITDDTDLCQKCLQEKEGDDVIDAARDVMDAVRDVIPVACEALPSKMLLLLWLRSIPCFNATAATREALEHDQELTNEDLIEMEDHQEPVQEEENNPVETPVYLFTLKRLEEAFASVKNACDIFESQDSNFERSRKVAADLNKSIVCYREIYNEKKKKRLLSKKLLVNFL
ncbi:Tigger transposable element-derived protein 1 [Nymphon striatum]|nr:Tigger transposable element-derived protein 1 [Nymphon striatum]